MNKGFARVWPDRQEFAGFVVNDSEVPFIPTTSVDASSALLNQLKSVVPSAQTQLLFKSSDAPLNHPKRKPTYPLSSHLPASTTAPSAAPPFTRSHHAAQSPPASPSMMMSGMPRSRLHAASGSRYGLYDSTRSMGSHLALWRSGTFFDICLLGRVDSSWATSMRTVTRLMYSARKEALPLSNERARRDNHRHVMCWTTNGRRLGRATAPANRLVWSGTAQFDGGHHVAPLPRFLGRPRRCGPSNVFGRGAPWLGRQGMAIGHARAGKQANTGQA
ncbi:hypothetical protein IWZ01DRAFT_124721 [Phyllosticta capitalensis]